MEIRDHLTQPKPFFHPLAYSWDNHIDNEGYALIIEH
jgi:hypothetical protein